MNKYFEVFKKLSSYKFVKHFVFLSSTPVVIILAGPLSNGFVLHDIIVSFWAETYTCYFFILVLSDSSLLVEDIFVYFIKHWNFEFCMDMNGGANPSLLLRH